MNQDEIKKIEEKVREIIADSLCVELDEVVMKSNLIKDLGAESIDFLDIMFRLEKEFNIKIPQREIERQARGGMSPEEFEVEGIVQKKGAARLRELLPEIEPTAIKEGMHLRELPAIFTVELFCGIVKRKLEGTLFDPAAASAPSKEITTP